jgi:hypothetical protein
MRQAFLNLLMPKIPKIDQETGKKSIFFSFEKRISADAEQIYWPCDNFAGYCTPSFSFSLSLSNIK